MEYVLKKGDCECAYHIEINNRALLEDNLDIIIKEAGYTVIGKIQLHCQANIEAVKEKLEETLPNGDKVYVIHGDLQFDSTDPENAVINGEMRVAPELAYIIARLLSYDPMIASKAMKELIDYSKSDELKPIDSRIASAKSAYEKLRNHESIPSTRDIEDENEAFEKWQDLCRRKQNKEDFDIAFLEYMYNKSIIGSTGLFDINIIPEDPANEKPKSLRYFIENK